MAASTYRRDKRIRSTALRHFDFDPSTMGTVSRSFRDLTISCVAVLYCLKCDALEVRSICVHIGVDLEDSNMGDLSLSDTESCGMQQRARRNQLSHAQVKPRQTSAHWKKRLNKV